MGANSDLEVWGILFLFPWNFRIAVFQKPRGPLRIFCGLLRLAAQSMPCGQPLTTVGSLVLCSKSKRRCLRNYRSREPGKQEGENKTSLIRKAKSFVACLCMGRWSRSADQGVVLMAERWNIHEGKRFAHLVKGHCHAVLVVMKALISHWDKEPFYSRDQSCSRHFYSGDSILFSCGGIVLGHHCAEGQHKGNFLTWFVLTWGWHPKKRSFASRVKSQNATAQDSPSLKACTSERLAVFRPSATVSRIGLMESRMCRCHWHGGPPPLLATPSPKVAHDDAGCLMESCLSWCGDPPPWLADTPPGWLTPHPHHPHHPPYVMDGWGARPLRWLSVLVCLSAMVKISNG